MNVEFDPFRILHVLDKHGVRFVVIGGMAVRVWAPAAAVQNDLDICYDAANVAPLHAALRELHATPRDDSTSIDSLAPPSGVSRYETDAGALDCIATPPGTSGYNEVAADATRFDFDGAAVAVASRTDLIRMKRAFGRPKDRLELELLSR